MDLADRGLDLKSEKIAVSLNALIKPESTSVSSSPHTALCVVGTSAGKSRGLLYLCVLSRVKPTRSIAWTAGRLAERLCAGQD